LINPWQDVLPAYEQQFIASPLSAQWGSGPSYPQLRWYDTGLIGNWMQNHQADTLYTTP